jgi:tRNA(adenine34) deaminase
MNPLSKVIRNLIGPGTKAEIEGRLPPVPLGWRSGAPGIAGRSPTATPVARPVSTVEPSDAETSAEGTPAPQIVVRPIPMTRPSPSAPPPPTSPGPRPTIAPKVTETDLAMMARAIELAKQALALGEVPIGAVVYETATGKLLGEGYNRREIDKDPSAHAEWFAIKEASEKVGDWRLNHCTLVVTLEPCVMCSGLIVNARIGRLIYGPRDPKAGGAESLFRLTNDPRLNHRVEPVSEVMQPECAKLLSDFFKSLREKKPAN